MPLFKNSHFLTDEEIVSQIVHAKNKDLMGILYQRYYTKVYCKCLSFVKRPTIAEDLTQDIFVKLYDKIDSFKEEARFSTWLFVVVSHYCIDYTRKAKRERVFLANDYPKLQSVLENLADSEDNSLEELLAMHLEGILSKISVAERNLLYLKYCDGITVKELSTRMGVSDSSIKMRIKRTRDKMKVLRKETYGY